LNDKKKLFRIHIDLDLSSNPTIREMFTDAKAGQEIRLFLNKNGLHLERAGEMKGEAVAVEITGPSSALLMFVDKFLHDDAPGGVYSLEDR